MPPEAASRLISGKLSADDPKPPFSAEDRNGALDTSHFLGQLDIHL
jgi:hypothetical protein